MKTLKKVFLASLLILGSSVMLNAQDAKNHEFKLFYGTGDTGAGTELFGSSLANGLLGYQSPKVSSFGMVGAGYRYSLNRFSLGFDLAYSKVKEELFKLNENKNPVETTLTNRFMVMPMGEFTYYSTEWVRLYGAAGAGVLMSQTTVKGLTNTKPSTKTNFAYQINPIGVRVGNQIIGGFLEAGYGDKGILTAGVSLSF